MKNAMDTLKWILCTIYFWFAGQEKKDKALCNAAVEGDIAKAQVLLARGARIDAAGRFPLHDALWQDHKEMAKFLIERGAKVDAADKEGMQPLHFAAIIGDREVMELMIAKGADFDAPARNGWQPLHIAAMNGHRDVVEMLLGRGTTASCVVNDLGQWGSLLSDFCNDEEILKRVQEARNPLALAALHAQLRKLGNMRPKGPSI